jgi:hypothetical protein
MYPDNESKNVTSFVSQCVTSVINLIYDILEPELSHSHGKTQPFNAPTEAEDLQISFTLWWQGMP